MPFAVTKRATGETTTHETWHEAQEDAYGDVCEVLAVAREHRTRNVEWFCKRVGDCFYRGGYTPRMAGRTKLTDGGRRFEEVMVGGQLYVTIRQGAPQPTAPLLAPAPK